MPTAVPIKVETDLPADLSVRYCGMRTIQPAGRLGFTSFFGCTRSVHSSPCSPFKSMPSTDGLVALVAFLVVGYLPVSLVEFFVILTFYEKKTAKS